MGVAMSTFEKVFQLSKKERRTFVVQNELCIHCLIPGHHFSMCTWNRGKKCNISGCKNLHHRLLHGSQLFSFDPECVLCDKEIHGFENCPKFKTFRFHIDKMKRKQWAPLYGSVWDREKLIPVTD
jgi:hypothetical protein